MTVPELTDVPLSALLELSARCEIILGSSSPRRKMFMTRSGVPFSVAKADIDEIVFSGEEPAETAKRLAEAKARAVAESIAKRAGPSAMQVIIGSDTIVWYSGAVLGKPHDAADAQKMLQTLSGQTHTVYTAVCLLVVDSGSNSDRAYTDYAQTDVTFIELTNQRISDYVATGDPLDKAGSYGAQEYGAFLVDHMVGELDTVIGFPRALVNELAERALISC